LTFATATHIIFLVAKVGGAKWPQKKWADQQATQSRISSIFALMTKTFKLLMNIASEKEKHDQKARETV